MTAVASGPLADALDAIVERFDPEVLALGRQGARLRIVAGDERWDVTLGEDGARRERPAGSARASLDADAATWAAIAQRPRAGLDALRTGELRPRGSSHLAVGFLAAVSLDERPDRLRFAFASTSEGRIALLSAGTGEPVVCIHGLGGSKASYLPTVAALAGNHRVIALDLPGFGASGKPRLGSYTPAHFARAVVATLDALELEHPHVIGHSLGGRVALELAFYAPDRAARMALVTPSLPWISRPAWSRLIRLTPPTRLGLIQPAPRAVVERIVRRLVADPRLGAKGSPWVDVAIDEFLAGYLTAGGRTAFYRAAKGIALERPELVWERMPELRRPLLFVWGTRDQLVPASFREHVERALPSAAQLTLDCGHLPQLERPRELHAALRSFLAG